MGRAAAAGCRMAAARLAGRCAHESAAERASAPVERARDAAQPTVVLVPLALQVAADHDRRDRAGAGALEASPLHSERSRRWSTCRRSGGRSRRLSRLRASNFVRVERRAVRLRRRSVRAAARVVRGSGRRVASTIARSGWCSSRTRLPDGTVVTISNSVGAGGARDAAFVIGEVPPQHGRELGARAGAHRRRAAACSWRARGEAARERRCRRSVRRRRDADSVCAHA